MAKASHRQGTPGWSQLEQSFFDTAPPDVAVIPPPAPTFDDLGPVLPERRKVRRDALPRQAKAAGPAASRSARARQALAAAQGALAALLQRVRPALARLRALVVALLGRARPALQRARAWGTATAREGWRRLTVNARRTRSASGRALRAALSRFLDELPGERPDGRTVLATVAAIVVLCSLSATVLGRGSAWRGSTPAPAPAPTTVVGSSL